MKLLKMNQKFSKNMSKLTFLLISMLLSLQVNAQKNIKIISKNNEMILKGKNEYKYYRLDKTKPTKISLRGPGTLKVIVRVKSTEMNQVSSKPFNIKCISDNKKISLKTIPNLTKSAKFSTTSKWISLSKEFKFKVLPDRHNFTFFLIENTENAYVHFVFIPAPKVKWEERKSINTNEEKATLVSDKNKDGFTYYRVNDKMSFKDTVRNSEYIKIITRPEFKHSEFSDLTMRIGLKINGKIVKTYTINSRRSKVLRYKENGKMIPGTSDKIYYKLTNKEVPIEYEIVVIGSKKSVLIRVKTSK